MLSDRHIPPEFREQFRRLVVAFQPRSVAADAVAVYWELLAPFGVAQLVEAGARLAVDRKFFPTAAEWADQARALRREQHRATVPPSPTECGWCFNRGVIVVTYASGEPADLALCGCAAGRFYRAAGEDAIRDLFQLADDTRVADVDAFAPPADLDDLAHRARLVPLRQALKG